MDRFTSGLRVAVYLRQSLDKTGDELAVSRQREACQRIITERGWTLAGEYVDNSISATDARKNRPGYNALIKAYEAGEYEALVCYDLDRLTRQPRQLEDWIERAEGKGLALVTANGEADLTTDSGRLFARIKAAVARGEVERKSARQKAAGAQRAESGKAWWPSRPFGYADNRGTALNPDEAALLADAYRYVQLGGSLNAIATEWNRAGVKTTKGNKWRGATVRQLLINARNCALRYYNGVEVGAADWPAIVDADTWRSVVAILDNPERRSGPTRGRKFVLSGIAVCGVCDEPLKSGFASATATKRPVYLCKSAFHVSRRMDEVDAWVIEHAVERLTRRDAIDVLVNNERPDVEALSAEAATLRARLNELAVSFADGDITAEQMRIATERIKGRLAEVERQLFDADAYRVFDGLIDPNLTRERFDALPLARKRSVIDRLMTVRIMPAGKGKGFDPERVVIDWR